MLFKNDLCSHVKLVANSDCMLLASLAKDVCGFPVLFACVYCPPEGSVYANEDMFVELEQFILDNNDGKEVCLLGDFNARTATRMDYDPSKGKPACDDETLNEYEYLLDRGFDLKRYSEDNRTNNYGHRLIELCKNLGILIVNGRLSNDRKKGKLTCRQASVVDYIICSPVLYSNIVFFDVVEFNPLFSDVHNALECHIKIRDVIDSHVDVLSDDVLLNNDAPRRPRWQRGFKDMYVENLNALKISELENALERLSLADTARSEQVQDLCNSLVHILTESGRSIGSIKDNIKVNPNVNGRKQVKQIGRAHV